MIAIAALIFIFFSSGMMIRINFDTSNLSQLHMLYSYLEYHLVAIMTRSTWLLVATYIVQGLIDS